MTTPTTTPATMAALDDDARQRLTDVRQHAAECGRLDCGHLARSVNMATRRAVILYTGEAAGLTVLLDNEPAEVAAIVGVLRDSGHARPTYVRGTLPTGNRGMVRAQAGMTVLPNAAGIKITNERREVFTFMLRGYSASQISSDLTAMPPRVGLTPRARATVQSHAGYLRRLTGGHDATSCLIALVLAGKLSDPSLVVPAEPVETDETEPVAVADESPRPRRSRARTSA